jgi:heptaprenyl diphosphate synthase
VALLIWCRSLEGVAATLPLDLESLEADLHRVEDALRESVATDDAFLTEVAHTLIKAGGKRLRPVLTLAAAYMAQGADGGSAVGPQVTNHVVDGAVACELIHLGSLYHDDVMDEAATRRGVETANSRYGNFAAIVAGDYCLAVSAQIAARLGVEVSALLGYTIGQLCKGQVGELVSLFSQERTEENYFISIDGKTASLMAAACKVGALMSNQSPAEVEALTTYGHCVGMVFQIADDILDLIATDEQLGKPAGNDLVEGVYTLPVLRAFLDPSMADELKAALTAGVERASVDQVRKLVRASTGVDAALLVARTYADQAVAALSSFPASPTHAELAALPHRLLDRLPL